MKKISLVTCLVVLLLSLSAMTVLATPWTQQFNESGVGKFDQISVFMTSGTEQFIGSDNYSNPHWSAISMPNCIMASGPDLKNLNFNLDFTGTSPFQFDFFALNHKGNTTEVVDAALVRWNNGWHVAGIKLSDAESLFDYDMSTVCSETATPVPEQGTILLLSTGLFALVIVSKRKNFCIPA